MHENKFWNTKPLLSSFWYIYIYFCCRWKRMLYYILILNFKFVPIWPNLSFPCLKRTDISCQPTEDGHEELQLDFAVPLFHHKEGHSLRMINGTIQLTQLDGYYIHHHQVHISAGKKTEPDGHINRMEMKSVYKIMRPMFRRTKAIRRFSGRPIWWKVKTWFQACQNVNERSSRMNYHMGKGT